MTSTTDNIVCFKFVIDFRGNKDPEAWDRVMDAFIDAVEKEGAGAGGGMHPLGTNKNSCEDCNDTDN
jgi:hypothetical protein